MLCPAVFLANVRSSVWSDHGKTSPSGCCCENCCVEWICYQQADCVSWQQHCDLHESLIEWGAMATHQEAQQPFKLVACRAQDGVDLATM